MRYKIFVITSLCISTLGCVVRSDLLSQQQATDNAQALISQIDSEQLPDKYLSLYEIIAIGLTNNLQQRIRTLELGLTNPSIELSKIELLPKAAISSGFRARNEFDGIIATPGGALVDSDLYPEKNKYADLALSWNVLDFGVSYYKTKQALNNRKIIKEIQRKSIQQLSLDLESSFWHAAMHQHFDHTIEAEISAANEVLDVKKNSHKNASTSELEALIEMQHLATQLLTINNTLDQAKSQLNHLLGLPPDSSLRLASDFSQNVLSPKQIQTEHRLLLHKALVNHPEIKKSFYQGKNAEYEINKALLRFFPGLEFNLGYQYQDISNLSNQSWAEWGNKITWNLINVLKTPTHLRLHKSAKELNDLQTQALALAIGTQLYLAEQQYISLYNSHQSALKNSLLHLKLRDRYAKKASLKSNTQYYKLINYRLKALIAEIEKYFAFVEMRLSLAQIYFALGIDSLPDLDLSIPQDYEMLVEAIKMQMQEVQPATIDFIDTQFITANTVMPNLFSDFPRQYPHHHRYTKSPPRREKMVHLTPPSNRIVSGGDHTHGIHLLTARGWYQYNSRATFNGLKDAPYRIRKDGYRTYYHVYFKTYPDRESAEQGLATIPDFYKIFDPKVQKLPR